MAFGLIGLILLVVLVAAGVWLLMTFIKLFAGGISREHPMLVCPFCQTETQAGLHRCQHCDREL